ncbi:fos-related antigen 2-like [Actinia tenebrosa]|uniref:Fos-related antigen 2-like n=1 Tax=Actinia tenebrosa TaxID=6105 RepID=A0A6P8IG84_ACTTE|nr:fos-related antigen 2-like [Actinia tenebrosa]
MNGLYYSMNSEGNYLVLQNRAMPVPMDDSDMESNISSEDAGNFSEFSNPQTPPLSKGAADEVKLELQRAIRCRRVAQGLDEMPSLESQRSNSNQLSAAELEKRRLRRERNKLAAFKCRQRRKEHMQALEEETDGLNSANHTLETEIAALKEQKRELEEMLRSHDCLIVVNSSDEEDKKTS